jgi:hypothetical protein
MIPTTKDPAAKASQPVTGPMTGAAPAQWETASTQTGTGPKC